jgi:hypothetical protein
MRKINILFFLFLLLGSYIAQAQVVISTDPGATPDASSILDVQSTSKGLLLPRMTAAQRDAMTTKAEGLVIYVTDLDVLQVWNGSAWINLAANPNSAPQAYNVTFSGTLEYGETLTGSYTYMDPDGDPDVSTYKWYAADDGSGTGAAEISGATALTYVLTTNETGKYIAFEVTPRASAGASPGTLVLSDYQGPVTCPVPAQPSEITGNTMPCNGATDVTYSVEAATGVTYNWSVPSGWSITAGSGTNEITVTVGSTSGDVEVYFSNDCGNGDPSTLAATVLNVPAQPSEITGTASPCENATGLTYSVTDVSGLSYAWTVPTGWSITAGQGSNEVTVDAGTEAGNIEVTPSNTCGDGTARTLAVTTTAAPGAPTAGTHTPSQTQIVWNWNAVSGATGYKYNTTNDYGTATDNGTTRTYTQTGLTCETGYTLYVWAYNDCGNSSATTLTATTGTCVSYPSGTVHCITGGAAIVDVTNPTTGKTWMDRNLGASRVATSATDAQSYGDLYQWGRFSDGHQCRNSSTYVSTASTYVPNLGNSWDGKFINIGTNPYDWLTTQNGDLWQGASGTNNPCPTGYRLPTEAEMNAERGSWSSNDKNGAYASPLKFTIGGRRTSSELYNVGVEGIYWTSSTGYSAYNASYRLYFGPSYAGVALDGRTVGSSVRCIKN